MPGDKVEAMEQLTDAQCFAPHCNRTFWATTARLQAMTRKHRNRTFCPEHEPAE